MHNRPFLPVGKSPVENNSFYAQLARTLATVAARDTDRLVILCTRRDKRDWISYPQKLIHLRSITSLKKLFISLSLFSMLCVRRQDLAWVLEVLSVGNNYL